MTMQWYDTMRITRWSTSRATLTLDATGCHWMPPSGECLHCIIPAATMVTKINEKHKNSNKTHLLASSYGANQSLDVYENFLPWHGPSLSSSITTIGAGELMDISSYQTLSVDNIGKVIKLAWSSLKSGHICAVRCNAVKELVNWLCPHSRQYQEIREHDVMYKFVVIHWVWSYHCHFPC